MYESNDPSILVIHFTINILLENNFKINTFYVIREHLTFELNKRKSANDNILITKYSFILKIHELHLLEIRDNAKKLSTIYKQDLENAFIFKVY